MNDGDPGRDQGERDVREAEPTSPSGRSLAEWVTLGFSAALVISILGLITWLEFNGLSDQPRIMARVDLEQVREEDGVYYVPVVIENTGDKTVEEAVVEAHLDTGNGEPEVAGISVTFLAGGEHVGGAFIFSTDPRVGELTVRPVSYKEP